MSKMANYIEDLLDGYISLHGTTIDAQLQHQYSISYFSKSNFKENDIFTIHAKINGKKTRMGWIFPSLILASKEYDLFGDIHLDVYLRVAASCLASLSSGSFLDENTHLLILKDQTLISGNIIKENFAISLLKLGYYSEPVAYNVFNSGAKSLTSKIDLISCPPIYELAPYIQKLFLKLLPKVNDPLSRFISIYQTFELLMEKYFHIRIDEHRMKRSTIGTIRENITELSNERKLINGLFTYSEHRMQLSADEENLVRRLFSVDKSEDYYKKLTLPDFIYDIRNAIVHNYHKYELTTLMREIAEQMEFIWVELMENSQVTDMLKVKMQ
jgi:hypothetical protein